jgi:AraC-like DNA-binding protein/ligand-binding sensor protein
MTHGPSRGGTDSPDEDVFTRQFEKDLRFFQLLLLLINKSCPIKNVDLTWTGLGLEDLASGSRPPTGTTQALEDACSRLLRCEQIDPNPHYCQIISEQGGDLRCSTSDREAEDRAGRSGHTEVYVCPAGLVDIAVPVICGGRHIASLHSGQVHTSAPCHADFVKIRQQLPGDANIDFTELEAAYNAVPVVTEEDIRQTVGILEMFAAYLATAWNRLHDAVEAQQRRLRDAELHRKELAHLLLDGDPVDAGRLRELSRAAGFTNYPNRVLVISLLREDERASASSLDLAFARVQCLAEELCAHLDNVMVSNLRWRDICVFFFDPGPGDSKAYSLAQRLFLGMADRSDVCVRIGVGRVKRGWQRLGESYQEARAALAESVSTLALYKKPEGTAPALRGRIESVCQALRARRLQEARAGIQSIPMLAKSHIGEAPGDLAGHREFMQLALESIVETIEKLGCNPSALAALRSDAFARLELASTMFELQESWVSHAERAVDELGMIYSGKHEKLVERARSIVDRRLERGDRATPITLSEVAVMIGVSAGHLSRTFRRVSGLTFERYLMEKRVERAQRLLLDPVSRVSDVAERCDFCNPAYFARVFRKLSGCSPTEYSKNPIHARLHTTSPAAPAAASSEARV